LETPALGCAEGRAACSKFEGGHLAHQEVPGKMRGIGEIMQRGNAVASRTDNILGLNFGCPDAAKRGQVRQVAEFFVLSVGSTLNHHIWYPWVSTA
jgi:hypothetical protein